MRSSPRRKAAPGLVRSVRTDDDRLYVTLTDGRAVSQLLPPWLKAATPKQRRKWEIEEFGAAVWWPDLDDGIHVAHVLGISEEEVYDFAGFTREMPKE